MSEHKIYNTVSDRSIDHEIDASEVSKVSSSDLPEMQNDINYGLANDPANTGSSALGTFHQFLIWLLLVLVIVGLWQLKNISNDLSALEKKYERYDISMVWMEDNQSDYKAKIREELSKSQKRIEKMRRNLEFGGVYGKEMKLKAQVAHIENRLQELDRQLTEDRANAALATRIPEKQQVKLNVLEGKWAINLRSFSEHEKSAQKIQQQLNESGVAASIVNIRVGDKVWNRMFIGGFGTYQDAKQYAEDVLAKTNIKNYWIRLEK